MTHDEMDTTIRCRLSDGYAAAVEFSALDALTLAAGARRAYERYVTLHGARTLELQVRPIGVTGDGWFVPVRDNLPVRVSVSADLLDRRPPDDWTEIWSWVAAARQGDRAIAQFIPAVVDQVMRCANPPRDDTHGPETTRDE
jgi:hypothetical protein